MAGAAIRTTGLRSTVAIDFIAFAAALLLLSVGSLRAWRVIVAKAVAGVVALGCLATFVEHTFELQWDDFILWQSPGAPPVSYPGPVMPFDSACFVLLGISLLFYGTCWSKKVWLAQLFSVLVFIPNFLVLWLYLIGQSHLCIYVGCR